MKTCLSYIAISHTVYSMHLGYLLSHILAESEGMPLSLNLLGIFLCLFPPFQLLVAILVNKTPLSNHQTVTRQSVWHLTLFCHFMRYAPALSKMYFLSGMWS